MGRLDAKLAEGVSGHAPVVDDGESPLR